MKAEILMFALALVGASCKRQASPEQASVSYTGADETNSNPVTGKDLGLSFLLAHEVEELLRGAETASKVQIDSNTRAKLVCIAFSESGWNPNLGGRAKPSEKREGRIGLFQVSEIHFPNPSEKRLPHDPEFNTLVALEVFKSQGIDAWLKFQNEGKFREFKNCLTMGAKQVERKLLNLTIKRIRSNLSEVQDTSGNWETRPLEEGQMRDQLMRIDAYINQNWDQTVPDSNSPKLPLEFESSELDD